MENNVIITMCHTQYDNLVNKFIPTLREKGKFHGDILVCGYDLDDYGFTKLKEAGCIIYDRRIINNWQYTVNMLRPVHFMESLLNYAARKSIDHVAYMDCGDISFQDSIEYMWQDELGLILEGNLKWKESEWGLQVLSKFNNYVSDRLFNSPIRNLGFFTANYTNFLLFCQHMNELHRAIDDSQFSYFGIDQAFACNIYETANIPTKEMSEEYNYVTQTHNWVIKDDKCIWDLERNFKPTIIHDAGFAPFRKGYKLYKGQK